MARTLPLLLGALLALPAPAEARRRCAAERSTTVHRNEHVRVYRQIVDETEVFACSLRTGRRVYLGVSAGDPDWDVRHVTLLGRRVAWSETECSEGCSVADVAVADLGGRRPSVFRTPARGRVFRLVMTPAGAIAWTAFEGPSTIVLRKADADGVAELARGNDLARHSLAASGSRVYWTQAGVAHSALLLGGAR